MIVNFPIQGLSIMVSTSLLDTDCGCPSHVDGAAMSVHIYWTSVIRQ